MSVSILFLLQIMQVVPGPMNMEPAPSVDWTCRLQTEKASFALRGRAPDFAGRREPYARQPIQIATDGPGWTAGQHDIVAVASAADFRRYLVSWEAKDGGSYRADIVLLRNELGISHLTYRPSPSGPVTSIYAKLVASGVCESKFPTASAGTAAK